MISETVLALFKFIDFLESNKKQYIQVYIPLINKVLESSKLTNGLEPEKNYKDKIKYNEIHQKISNESSLITNEVVIPMLNKLLELQVWNGEDTFVSIFNINIHPVLELTRNFNNSDIKEIQKYSQKYLNFRNETNTNFLSLVFLFEALDKVLNSLFSFFNDATINEYELFETKPIIVNSIEEGLRIFLGQPLPPEQIEPENKQKEPELLSELITHKDSVDIVNAIKVQFKNIRGKRLKLLLLALQDLKLIPKERYAQRFHACCSNEFEWDISSYNAMNGYNYNDYTDSIDLNNMKEFLQAIIKTK